MNGLASVRLPSTSLGAGRSLTTLTCGNRKETKAQRICRLDRGSLRSLFIHEFSRRTTNGLALLAELARRTTAAQRHGGDCCACWVRYAHLWKPLRHQGTKDL